MSRIMQKHNYIRFPMIVINIALTFFLMYVIINATELICANLMARSFLEEMKLIPLVPQQRKERVFILLALMLSNIGIRETIAKEQRNLVYVLCALDIVVSVLIVYNLSFAYKGILLLTFANIIHYIDRAPLKNILCSITIVMFILFDYNFLSYFFNLVSINHLIAYYPKSQQITIHTISNILSSLNEILLFVYMIVIVQEQVNQNRIINQLNQKLNTTVDMLQSANLELENYAKLSEESAKIKERNRLAREIHDTVGHTLTGISMGLEATLTLLGSDATKAKGYIVEIQKIARNGLRDVRRSVNELRVDAIEQYTLLPAIEKMVEEIRRLTQCNATLEIRGNADILMIARNEEETIYRIVQESTTNAIKHSNFDTIVITLDFREYEVEILITDNGKVEGEIVKGFGITHMEERVHALNGTVKRIGSSDDGFCVNVVIPLKMRSII